MKKRIISLIIASMLLGLSGCGNNQSASAGDQNENREYSVTSDETVEQESDIKDEEAGAPDLGETEQTDEEVLEVKQTEEPVEEEVEDIKMDIYTAEELVNFSSVEFAPLLKMGWNLGNTLDANTVGGLESETCWGMPETTQEMISYVKKTGVTTIRIPVSWGKHTDDDYQIDKEWMDRVKEVVDYAYNEGMFVIINSHHDNDFYYPSDENYENAANYLSTIWAQIADEFKEYDNHLIFESMNEPRLSGTDIEWWFNITDPKGCAAINNICKLNQVFVDTIRAGEGNNPTRFLMVPSYAASPDYALHNAFSMPNDAAEKLLLSVHAYTPYDFAGKGNGYSDWDGSKTYEFNFMGKLMAKFIQDGYGVVIGEFGATNKANDADRIKWARGYCMKAADYGMSYIVWDNGLTSVGEENFGLIDRNNLTLFFPELMDAYLCGYKSK